jgi:hypothetical protein
MASQQPSFEFKPGSLGRNLKNFNGDLDHLVAAVVDYRGDRAIAWMRTKAKWTDRTGNARQTLSAHAEHKVYANGFEHEIHLYGGMPYQIWLEVRHAGKFAIIGPAVKYQGLALMKQLTSLMTKLSAR